MTRPLIEQTEPIWLLLPRWLHAAATAAARRRRGPAFLHDVLQAQHCLFMHVRLHDDLFDGQSDDPRTVLVGDQFLMQSERLFARHLDGAFWPLFRHAVATTIAAILETDRRQCGGRANIEALELYAQVGEIFKIGASAVCLATRRRRLLPDVSGLLDELSVISQIFDDLHDVEEDRDRGRTNFVAALTHIDRTGRIETRRAAALTAELRRRAARARVHARGLSLAPALSYVDRVSRRIDALEAAVHRVRVDAMFAEVVSGRNRARHGSEGRARDGGPSPRRYREPQTHDVEHWQKERS